VDAQRYSSSRRETAIPVCGVSHAYMFGVLRQAMREAEALIGSRVDKKIVMHYIKQISTRIQVDRHAVIIMNDAG